MPEYKVVVDQLTVDGVDFKKDDVLVLEKDAFNVPELISGGSIVEVEVNEDEVDAPDPEPTDTDEDEVAA